MIYIFLLGLVSILSVASIILAVFVIEGRHIHGHKPMRAWRIAWSKRKQINSAIARCRDADQRAAQAFKRMEWEQRDADRVRKEAQASIDFEKRRCVTRLSEMGSYIIAEQSGTHIKSIKANNYHAKEKKVLRAVEVAAKHGYHLPKEEQSQLARMLEQAHDAALRAEEEKQKQSEIKQLMREEERDRREIERAVKKAEEEQKRKEREADIKRKALEEAIALLGDTHSEKIEEMKRMLVEVQAEAEAARLAAERTKSMAEQTRRGHIYIISNIGSFGKDMFKVGMTRRLEPMDRVKELGDASVPFRFDVHAMISSSNAPALEAALHRRLNAHRVNKVNHRKEFFRVPIHTIIEAVKSEHGQVEYKADPEALEYLESLEMSKETTTLGERITAEASKQE